MSIFEKKAWAGFAHYPGIKGEIFPSIIDFCSLWPVTLSDLDRFDEAFATTQEIEKGFQVGKSPFVHQLRPRFWSVDGTYLFSIRRNMPKPQITSKGSQGYSCFITRRTRASAFTGLGMIPRRPERKETGWGLLFQSSSGEKVAKVPPGRSQAISKDALCTPA